MTTTDLLKQALHALELESTNPGLGTTTLAIHDLRDALAQPTSAEYAQGYAEGFNDACKKPQAEPDMRHPEIQAIIGGRARAQIALRLVEELIENPDFETTALDMEHWDTMHDKLKERLLAAPAPADLIPQDSLFVCGQMGAHVTRVRVEPAPAPKPEPYFATLAREVDRLAPAPAVHNPWADDSVQEGDAEKWGAVPAVLPVALTPLTDDRIDEIWDRIFGHDDPNRKLSFRQLITQAIEAAHGIKGSTHG